MEKYELYIQYIYICIGPVMFWQLVQDLLCLSCVGCWNRRQPSHDPDGGGTENAWMECNNYMG